MVTGVLASVAVILTSLVVFVFADSRFPETVPQVASAIVADPYATVSLVGKSAIVLDVRTGTVLFELNADEQLPLASLTKVPLVFVVADALELSTRFSLPEHIPPTGTANGIAQGTVMTGQQLIDYILAASSNEGAELLARLADAVVHDRFPESPAGNSVLWRMNALADERGLSRTYFSNVSGLDIDATTAGSYGSARDVASLFAYIAGSRPDVFAKTTDTRFAVGSVAVGNTNDAIPSIPGLILGKTGFTDLAGGNLVVVFDAGPARPVAIVVLGSTKEDRFTDVKKLAESTRHALAQ